MYSLTPDTSVELLIKDSKGLIEVLRERENCRARCTPLPRASEASNRWVCIGSKLPIEDIREILTAALTRYDKLQYYSISNDYYLCEFFREFEISIGLSNQGARDRGLAPIKPGEMLRALETFESTDQLTDYVRTHYEREFETFDIEPIAVSSYYSATAGAAPPPASSLGRINGSEYLATTTPPELYGLTIRMHADSVHDATEQAPEVNSMFREWIENRANAANEFSVCVSADESLHHSIICELTEALANAGLLADASDTLRISIVVANRANDARTIKVLTDD